MSVACCFNTGAHSSGGREQGASSQWAARPGLCSDGETQTEPGAQRFAHHLQSCGSKPCILLLLFHVIPNPFIN